MKDRLRNRSFILFQAIGPATYRGFLGGDRESTLKWYAYTGGSTALNFLLGIVDAPGDSDRSVRLRRMAIAAKSLPIDRVTGPRLVRLLGLHDELVPEPRPGVLDAIRENLSAMLEVSLHQVLRSDRGHRDRRLRCVRAARGESNLETVADAAVSATVRRGEFPAPEAIEFGQGEWNLKDRRRA